MTANKTYLSTNFPFEISLFVKRISLINKVNFKKCFPENYKRMSLTTRVYGTNSPGDILYLNRKRFTEEIMLLYCFIKR